MERNNADEKQMLHAEAVLTAVCSSIAKNRSLDCSSNLGSFVKENLLRGMASLIPEPAPDYDAQFDEHPSWGTPAQRIDAAIGIYNLTLADACLDARVTAQLRAALEDPVPAVRFQAVIRLLWLHDKNPDLMWRLINLSCGKEASPGVLSGLLSYSLNQLAGRYPNEVLGQLKVVKARFPILSKPSSVNEWTLRIPAGLYIWQDNHEALGIFEDLLSKAGFLPQPATQLLLDSRELYTYRSDQPSDFGEGIRKRAFELSERVVRLAQMELLSADKDADSERQTQLARTLDFVSNQIYFGSGAYDGTNRRSLSTDDRLTFWKESQGVIEALTDVALPSIAHHLIQTLQSFITFEPASVFHRIAAVVASAQRFGYQYESMAVDLLVQIAELYLAQYPGLLQHDEICRAELMAMLETFVTAGWPSAFQLIYRLEEMYR